MNETRHTSRGPVPGAAGAGARIALPAGTAHTVVASWPRPPCTRPGRPGGGVARPCRSPLRCPGPTGTTSATGAPPGRVAPVTRPRTPSRSAVCTASASSPRCRRAGGTATTAPSASTHATSTGASRATGPARAGARWPPPGCSPGPMGSRCSSTAASSAGSSATTASRPTTTRSPFCTCRSFRPAPGRGRTKRSGRTAE